MKFEVVLTKLGIIIRLELNRRKTPPGLGLVLAMLVSRVVGVDVGEVLAQLIGICGKW